jgi:hypothetical protein
MSKRLRALLREWFAQEVDLIDNRLAGVQQAYEFSPSGSLRMDRTRLLWLREMVSGWIDDIDLMEVADD